MASKLRIRQVKSAIHRNEKQKKTIRALGIHRLHQTVELPDNACTRGMVKRVEHLVEVEEVND